MLVFGALRFAADRRGGKLGRRPDGSFLARPPTQTVGQQPTVATDSSPGTHCAEAGFVALEPIPTGRPAGGLAKRVP